MNCDVVNDLIIFFNLSPQVKKPLIPFEIYVWFNQIMIILIN